MVRTSGTLQALVSWAILAALWIAPGSPARSAEPAAVETGSPTAITLEPATFELRGSRARQQLLVTGQYATGDVRDLTPAVEYYVSANPNVLRIENTVAYPVADGTATLLVKLGDLQATAEVRVTGMGQAAAVSFKNETLAALTKAGCNMGACHGSPSGKAGFRLSLRGYDAELDIMTLRSEFYSRRANILQPAESLLLKKPLMEVAHGGGRRLMKGDPSYTILHNWVAEGMQLDKPETAELLKIEVVPSLRTLRAPAARQQIIVQGHFSDGSVQDLTALTQFSSSAESVASVDDNGLVTKEGRGETAILARYLDKMATSYIAFLEDVPGFAWNNPPAHNFVDGRVYEKLQKLQILPSDLCSDDEFLRRASLDVIGRLPTIEETQAFLTDQDSDKRAKLVDRLLETPEFADFWTLKWADVLRANNKKLTDIGVHKFRRWIYDSMLNDKPLDQFARELLTASGSVYETPAASYWKASRDPSDATETTAQLFLGIRIQCAKCHNHPFERWTQDNYYGIAAAFARIGYKPGDKANEEVVFVKDAGEVTQPRTGRTMPVHLLLKGDIEVPAAEDRRDVFADWLTGPENPFFAKSVVNRIWGHLMGRGIVEPVDDFRDSNPPSNAELLDELTAQFVSNGFSQKWAIRTIMNSRTYQLSSRKNDFNRDDEQYFSHANTRLLSAEQLLDAICFVTGVPESFPGLPPGTRAVELPEPPADHYFLKIFGQPQREMACECERSDESNLSQALQMINGPTVHGKLRADNGRIQQMIAASKPDDEIITTLYLAALCRQPSAEELGAAKQHVAAGSDRRQGLEDVGWAVLNTKEFLFQH